MITCICPTGDRQEWIGLAIECFLKQTITNAELLVLDDGKKPTRVPKHPRIRHHRLDPWIPKLTTGEKRNLCCDIAACPVIAHWDDDDWYAPNRLELQLQHMAATGKPVVGHHAITYWDTEARSAFKFVQGPAYNLPYACGTSMMYRRDYWRDHKFMNIRKAEDSTFSEYARANKFLASCDGTQLVVARAHSDSTSPVKQYAGVHELFPAVPLDQVPELFLRDIGQCYCGPRGACYMHR